MADHFDRLLARSVPGLPAADQVVRPRLPRLYERFDAEPEAEVEVWPTAPAPVVRPATGPRGPEGPRGPAGGTPGVPAPPAAQAPPEVGPPAPGPVPVRVIETVISTERTRHEVVREPLVEHRSTTLEVTGRPAAPVAELRPRHTTVVVPPPVVEPRRAPAPALAPVAAPPPQPLVQVSIGRVEVTAAEPERGRPPRPRVRRAEPVLSLERYLAREDDRR
ncbi:hypothetical protein [Saccharothrix luteola]|uniref:hypothetical protein n=1 Tax=Saccharothrix luteola TaxID=2893018 RepID=UPI001E359061|nr:hypothetical protein [Saccharothrix luteola]MCC8250482.1 hypothetical protein [Saccharothrix luteola]